MFEELGLNVARQPDNGANPRPGQPLAAGSTGETPDVVEEYLDTRADAERPASRSACGTRRRSCASSARRAVPPRPDGAPNRWPSRPADTGGGSAAMTDDRRSA